VNRLVSLLLATVLGVAGALVAASPAYAHTESAPAATNYLSRLTQITPQVEGLKIRLVVGGSRLELTNHTAHPVIVYGYSGEQYLLVTSGAVFVNKLSPTAYINEDLSKTDSNVDTTQQGALNTKSPQWQLIKDNSTVRWHDHRTHWMDDNPPATVEHNPEQKHRLTDWRIPIKAGKTSIVVQGTLDYLPPPPTGMWWALVLLVTSLVAVLGWWRYGLLVLATLLGIAGSVELLDGVSRVLDTGATGVSIVTGLITYETYGTLTALGALVAAGWALRRRAAAPFALALAATCLAVLGAFTDVAVFSYGRATAAWDGDTARVATLTTLALSVGVAIAAWRLLSTRIRAK
jgi:hypothetical protein